MPCSVFGGLKAGRSSGSCPSSSLWLLPFSTPCLLYSLLYFSKICFIVHCCSGDYDKGHVHGYTRNFLMFSSAICKSMPFMELLNLCYNTHQNKLVYKFFPLRQETCHLVNSTSYLPNSRNVWIGAEYLSRCKEIIKNNNSGFLSLLSSSFKHEL